MKDMLITVLLVFSVNLSWSQSSWGIKAGWNINNVKDFIAPDHAPPLVMTQANNGFHAGIVFEKSWSGAMGWQTEILYSLKGAKTLFMEARNQRFHYLSVPTMVRWKPFDFLTVHGGLEFSYLILDESSGSIRIIDGDRKLDMGAVIGFEVPLGKSIWLDARYVHGFTPLVNLAVFDQVSAPEAEYRWYNRVVQFSLVFNIH